MYGHWIYGQFAYLVKALVVLIGVLFDKSVQIKVQSLIWSVFAG